MQHLIEKNGFVPCGIIHLEDGSPRLAYERVCAESSLSVRQQKADKVIRDVVKLCRDFDAKKVILYGSRAKGTARERSDIDIAVIVERLDDDYFKDTPLLWKLRRKISNLIEPVLLTEDMDNPLYCDIRKAGILIQ